MPNREENKGEESEAMKSQDVIDLRGERQIEMKNRRAKFQRQPHARL